ncbi:MULTISPECIES: sulfurtransferase TusA family protein [Brevundimonas]|jgi:tRNA 2-thiouridine synthesizing protein A|uniref:sulfurtransferase TusA family protein n=1 Tax=Brevundimonas TaxID=41275 RepID=UPI0019081BB5|nr:MULTISPECIES: sulfurtransferase TusA family protein [Brevundimonas]MDA0742302.1 sulfurtransferase TusA family protein [Pseudomonadota bacterium]MBK1967772.1 sulfurtransferase TusA family protein [Brevundimonas diminuta]MBK1975364.1 sulfurtransferase TusA family protein [Brevundimonas diminuta]MDA1322348.1 sulfurtransferase TusA family protein [Pseudomonadota bacterium]MDM8353406.1 sulfurtransferase TusA family protein [Brevundimonas diminuta]
MKPVVVDARGHKCPVPSLRLRKAMDGRRAGERLMLLATDPMARIDVPFLMQELGGQVIQIEEADGVLEITVESGGARTG